MGSSGIIEKRMISKCISTKRSKCHQPLSPPKMLQDLLIDFSSSKYIEEHTTSFLKHWYTTNGEEAVNPLWIDMMVETHVCMKTFFDYVMKEARNNVDNSGIGALRFLSFIHMTGLAQYKIVSLNTECKNNWYLQAALNFMAKCFFGEQEGSEDNNIPLQNNVLRREIEKITQISLKNLDTKTIIPMICKASSNILNEFRLEKLYAKFKETLSK